MVDSRRMPPSLQIGRHLPLCNKYRLPNPHPVSMAHALPPSLRQPLGEVHLPSRKRQRDRALRDLQLSTKSTVVIGASIYWQITMLTMVLDVYRSLLIMTDLSTFSWRSWFFRGGLDLGWILTQSLGLWRCTGSRCCWLFINGSWC